VQRSREVFAGMVAAGMATASRSFGQEREGERVGPAAASVSERSVPPRLENPLKPPDPSRCRVALIASGQKSLPKSINRIGGGSLRHPERRNERC
jgi:hypothetical protein